MSPSTNTPDDTRGSEPQDAIAHRFAWFGKLPSAGDFVSRRMPYVVQQFWDQWCADGLEALKAGSTAAGLGVWGGTPKWAFVIPAQPGVPTGQLGLFAPSCDRVGRVFPFIVVAPLVPEQQALMLDRAALLGLAWGQVVAAAQQTRMGIEALDAALQAALADTLAADAVQDEDEGATLPLGLDPSSLPWPELSRNFDVHGSQSYWWSVPPASTGFESRLHTGPLRTVLFLDLCR